MTLSIIVHFRDGRYDAGSERPSESEWPPHPSRVFCALAASAEDDTDWAALRWLEQQVSPEVWADPLDKVYRGQTRAYVVQNAIEKGGGNLSWPGRTNGLRTRAFVVPAHGSFAVVWTEAQAPAENLDRLARLAWKVPYLGRSTTRAQVSVVDTYPPEVTGWVIYKPAEFNGGVLSRDLRVPYPGYVEALRSAHMDGRRSWEVARIRPYGETRSDSDEAELSHTTSPSAGPFADLMVWGIERPAIRVGGDQAVALASSLRKAVISRLPDPVPGQVSGHTDPGRPHVAFLAIPDVGHDHADGHVLGLALAIPRDLLAEDLASLLRAVILNPLLSVRFPSGRPLALRYGSDRLGLRSPRWTAANGGGAREWVTVTPLMLDGHVHRGRDEASEVARSLVIAGYPEPAEVEVSGTPMVIGGIWRPRRGTLPDGRPRRQMVHASVRFRESVTGPVLAGSLRYLGLGLFLPVSQLAPGSQRLSADGQKAGSAMRSESDSQEFVEAS
jgi:CRISPR-associated protein Csb2